MASLPTVDPLPFEQSYRRVTNDLQRWSKKILGQVDRMCDDVVQDMDQTLSQVNGFISLMKNLLIEQDKQLTRATSNEEMDCIEGRIELILIEIELLKSLAFSVNSRAVKFNSDLRITCHGKDIKSICDSLQSSNVSKPLSKPNTNYSHYRFLLSQSDALLLQSKVLPHLRLISSRYESVLSFEASDLGVFLLAFDSYWKLFPTQQEIRLLVPQHLVSSIAGKSGETLRQLQEHYQLTQMKVFTNLCPKSDERIVLLHGKSRRLTRDCLKEILTSLEKQSQSTPIEPTLRLYDPMNLSSKDVEEMQASQREYGGFISLSSQSTSSKHSRTKLSDEEDTESTSDEDDLDLNNDDWWNYSLIREKSTEPTERTMMINSNQAGVVIGMNASRIDQIKQKTGAYVYINGETTDHKRAVIMKGTPEQVNRAYTCIENLIQKHKDGRVLLRRQHLSGKRKPK